MKGTITIPTEPIGSIPRPLELIHAVARGNSDDPALDPLYDAAIRDTIARFEETGSPVITDGEQRKYQNFWTYSVHGLANTAPDGFKIPRKGSLAIHANSSSTIFSSSTRRRSGAAWRRARTKCRSISPRGDWRSRVAIQPSLRDARHRADQVLRRKRFFQVLVEAR
ncbi:MAG TPA: hypothetical protein VF505_17925 [Thermoanaerobaculia bacterium]